MNFSTQTSYRFLKTYERLNSQSGWFDRSNLTIASQAALLVVNNAENRVNQLYDAVSTLKENASWIGHLNGTLAETIAVMALARNVDPSKIAGRSKDIGKKLKEYSHLNQSGLHFTSSCSFLALHTDQVVERALPRMNAIMEHWKQDHPWVTGYDDFFAATLHSLGAQSPKQIGITTEMCFLSLKNGGHGGWANEVQAIAQIIALTPEVDEDTIENNFRLLSKAMSKYLGWFAPNPRNAVALLAASSMSPEYATEMLIETYEIIKSQIVVERNFQIILSAGLVLAQHHIDQQHNKELLTTVIGIIYGQHISAIIAAGEA
jgi:hypothetical protein